METTVDAFLGGQVRIRQPTHGYRAGADPVFLAAATPARDGARVLELGCGAGTAMLCLLARVPGARVTGVELQPAMAALARDNLAENGFKATVIQADIADLPPALRGQSFDHVMANPPFFDRTISRRASDDGRETSRGETLDLSTWLDTAIRRLSPGGTLTLVNRAERLPQCLQALDDRVGDIRVLPLAPRVGRNAKLIVLQAKKGAKGPFALVPPLVLHRGSAHAGDGESYTAAAQVILRDGAPLVL